MPSLLVATDIEHLAAALSGNPAPATALAPAAAAELLVAGAGPVALTPTALAYLACDAVLTPVLTHGTRLLGTAAPTATISDDVRAALNLRDGSCRFPGCRRGAPQCHAHHVRYRDDGGPTLIENLVLLCAHHHRLVHYRGWKLTLHPDGTLDARFRGRTHTTRPRTDGITLAAGPPPKRRRHRSASTRHDAPEQFVVEIPPSPTAGAPGGDPPAHVPF